MIDEEKTYQDEIASLSAMLDANRETAKAVWDALRKAINEAAAKPHASTTRRIGWAPSAECGGCGTTTTTTTTTYADLDITPTEDKKENAMNLIGKYVIVRTYTAGVHAGILLERPSRREVVLTDSRRIWRWEGAASLSQLAMEGPNRPEGCKFSVAVDLIVLPETIEIMPCRPAAEQAIRAVPEWRA